MQQAGNDDRIDVLWRISREEPSDPPLALGAVAGIAASPALWFLQLLANTSLVNAVCGNRGAAAGVLIPGAVYAINAIAAAGALAAAALAFAEFRRIGGAKADASGEVPLGRRRFLSAWALAYAVVFLIAVLFNSATLLLPRACL